MGYDYTLNDPCHQVERLVDRCHSLYNRMSRNPDRPSWELEFCTIFIHLVEILSLLDNNLATSSLNLDDIQKRVSSLEARYSELLYVVSTKNG